MSKELLRIENIKAGVTDREILSGISLKINYGEVHVIMGPNGSGKSTLVNVIMNHPAYKVNSGKIFLDGEDISALTTDKRAQRGLFLSFQTPQEVPGISVSNFIRTAKMNKTGEKISMFKFQNEIEDEMDKLHMDHAYAERYLNVGFSGGEKKKSEILQMLMLKPKLAILDETDSGLDVDATRIVSEGIERFLSPDNAALIITHHRELVKNVSPDYVHIIIDGKIVKTGRNELIDEVERDGFAPFKERE